jgi:hypothetical protein
MSAFAVLQDFMRALPNRLREGLRREAKRAARLRGLSSRKPIEPKQPAPDRPAGGRAKRKGKATGTGGAARPRKPYHGPR